MCGCKKKTDDEIRAVILNKIATIEQTIVTLSKLPNSVLFIERLKNQLTRLKQDLND